MQYIHVKNLEKYHPGYKDRTLQWAKIYINMVQGDPETELLNEIDWSRLIRIILLELRAQKPLPVSDIYFAKNGFNIKKRSMSLTLQVLHNFLETVTEDSTLRHVDKDKEKDKEEDKDKESVQKSNARPQNLEEVKTFFKNDLQAESFYDHFSSNGWKVGGKTPMQDWKAAARNWMRRQSQFKTTPQPQQKQAFVDCWNCNKRFSSDQIETHKSHCVKQRPVSKPQSATEIIKGAFDFK